MTITNAPATGATVQHDADEAARRALAAVSLGAVAPESYAWPAVLSGPPDRARAGRVRPGQDRRVRHGRIRSRRAR